MSYPADVSDVNQVLWDTFRLVPPYDTGKKRWIQGCRLLVEACGEYGVRRVVQAEYRDWQHNRMNGKEYMVTQPGSLVGPCRARAGIMRQEATVVDQGDWGAVWAEIAAVMERGELHPKFSPVTAGLVVRCGGWDALLALEVDVAKVVLEGRFRQNVI